MKWQNTGSAPCYRPYRLAYRLQRQDGPAEIEQVFNVKFDEVFVRYIGPPDTDVDTVEDTDTDTVGDTQTETATNTETATATQSDGGADDGGM